MNRRAFLQRTVVTLPSLGYWLTTPNRLEAQSRSYAAQAMATSQLVPSTSIRDHLAAVARSITENATARCGSSKIKNPTWIREQRRLFLQMMGVDHLLLPQRTPPPVHITGTVDRPRYRIEKLHYESLPHLHVTANLYLPKGVAGPVPGVLYVCGHSKEQKFHYQAHARKFAEVGMACLIVETIQLGEAAGYHHGCYREGWWHWYSRGYAPGGIEMLNGIRGLDLLAARPEVNPSQLGVTGISGGGAASWWIAAADERVKAAAPVCGTATVFSHVHDRTVDGHCDCMWWINSHQWDLADVGALIAPRPLLIASADKDGIFTIESIRKVHSQIAKVYRTQGSLPNLRLIETPGGHSYHVRSRTEIFSWFAQHLQGRTVAPSAIGDIELDSAQLESVETLRIFTSSPPADNISPVAHDQLFQPAPFPSIQNPTELAARRNQLIQDLRSTTFAAFPQNPPELNTQIEFEFDEDVTGYRFGFTSEEGWRLHGTLLHSKPEPMEGGLPAVVRLESPREGRWDSRSYLRSIRAPWLKVSVATRGIGDTAWSDDLNWHLRRAAAWAGRTIPSMRVWDSLRAIQATRTLPGVNKDRIALAASGEMVAVGLYTALLDGNIRTLFLENPPASQNVAGEKDGRGPMLEMLQCLRLTDLNQVAALLWPCELVFIGEVPTSYNPTESLYRTLGAPGQFTRIAKIQDWTGPKMAAR